MSDAPHTDGQGVRPSAARLAAVGLLLLAVAVAAGCQSVKASSRNAAARVEARAQGIGTAEEATEAEATAVEATAVEAASIEATAEAPDREAPEDTSPDLAVDTTPTFVAVPPHAPLPAFDRAKYVGRPVVFVPNDKHEIALTFDDGPSKNTPTILSILAAHEARATFFMVVKRAEINDAAIVSVVAAGDEIANHTWSHRSLRHFDASSTALQVDRSQAILTAETGAPPAFVRPRGGKFDEAGRKALVDRGLIMVLWSSHANDIAPSPTPARIVKNVVDPAKPGSIILMHETNDNTVLALPKILDELRAKGLRPVTLSQLLVDGHP